MSFLESLNKLFGDPNEKELRKLWPIVEKVKQTLATPAIRSLTLQDLPGKTEEFKARVRDELGSGKTAREVLDALLPEAFAVGVRACELLVGQSVRIGKQEFRWDMVPFDVQILGGIALHRGCIAEMKTGEGKTLVCTLPAYLNALLGKGVHIVTVNDYLASRDSHWMGMLYQALGLRVGIIVHALETEGRRSAYACDITYGTNSEMGFDYLRDNMAPSIAHQVQRGLHYAIVDEVDSILIDEARTPLIISQPAEESTTKYRQYAGLVKGLQENVHFNRDEKQRTAVLTEEGIRTMEQMLGFENIYTEKGFEEVHHIEQALRAHAIYKRDVDYVVKDGEVIIVDEFTGRLMPGRRYSHGLHQAIEAKEGVEVQRESKTLATITFQNYFRLFAKLAGMTGTAKTEEEEFESIYKLRVVVIPTHRRMIREDKADAVYRTTEAKFCAVAKIAKEKFDRGQPILIGTTSIEKSEAMSLLLKELQVPHQVLNAKHHEKEAEIVSEAGKQGTVTIATNMAGRGTDIKLGEGVQELGGLAILGTERHEARRIDNQLRGRSGRQGDPGESQFFVSMEDDLMRLFGGDRLKAMMERLQVPDDVPLENRMVSRSIESAQKKVEGRNFDTRRHVLQYDDVLNKHRDIIYKRRQKILETAASLHEEVLAGMRREIESLVALHATGEDPETWDRKELSESVSAFHEGFAAAAAPEALATFQEREKLTEYFIQTVSGFYEEKCRAATPELVTRAESIVLLRSIDSHWMDHIDDMAHLREQVAFSGFAQRDPVIEYQDQGFRRFQELLATINATSVRTLLQADFAQFAPQIMVMEETPPLLETNIDQIEGELLQTGVDRQSLMHAAEQDSPLVMRTSSEHAPVRTSSGQARNVPLHLHAPAPTRAAKHIGRNDPCPCGSGKKYKKCHGRNA